MAKRKRKVSSAKKNNGAVAAAVAVPFIPPKVCRLCETKDGPFLNIFEGDKTAAKKIKYVMPFGVEENDELPHKICFRCSAKLEELYEFIQKCVKTQENLYKTFGQKRPVVSKLKPRSLWEQQLDRSNITNDDICDAVVKKALEGIQQQLMPSTDKPEVLEDSKKLKSERTNKSCKSITLIFDKNNLRPLKSKNRTEDNENKTLVVRLTRANRNEPPEQAAPLQNAPAANKNEAVPDAKKKLKEKPDTKESNIQINASQNEIPPPKPFNIMDYVSVIKVSGVGKLYQCLLCNRNFLKREVLASHRCSKLPKEESEKPNEKPDPPKPPAIKYINTKDVNQPTKVTTNETTEAKQSDPQQKPLEVKNKPKIGPKSFINKRVKLANAEVAANTVMPPKKARKLGNESTSQTVTNKKLRDSIQYDNESESNSPSQPYPVSLFKTVVPHHSSVQPSILPFYASPAKLQSCTVLQTDHPGKLLISKLPPALESKNVSATQIKYIQPTSTVKQPYQVTLNNSTQPKPEGFAFVNVDPLQSSYVLPTNNSTAPDHPRQDHSHNDSGPFYVVRDKSNNDGQFYVMGDQGNKNNSDSPLYVYANNGSADQGQNNAAPYYLCGSNESSNTQNNPPSQNNPGSFYVLGKNQQDNNRGNFYVRGDQARPEPNEHNRSIYTCNLCNETFSREQKLLVHIQSHYNKMDEEDKLLNEKKSRIRVKKF